MLLVRLLPLLVGLRFARNASVGVFSAKRRTNTRHLFHELPNNTDAETGKKPEVHLGIEPKKTLTEELDICLVTSCLLPDGRVQTSRNLICVSLCFASEKIAVVKKERQSIINFLSSKEQSGLPALGKVLRTFRCVFPTTFKKYVLRRLSFLPCVHLCVLPLLFFAHIALSYWIDIPQFHNRVMSPNMNATDLPAFQTEGCRQT